ncbi:DUF2218 domain-containing protein [Paracoccus sp. MBLB3053]|uniref:DUF2218 domain-containing protein n=1 Tax=Paracoccus aurantius TaxID=3073814 RepID=A0ABU2HXY6_9RHOB|nr:DUF2218 domain-containing protein [Paracoccus sp. MBLB3053]MDS9469881.1 DUF2218 domain-containing protein [Paracoccus sp. MBLB3053]
MSTMLKTTGHFATPNAQRYMTQLCKHFAHKVPATVEGDQAHVKFQKGSAQMRAGADDLEVTITTSEAEAVAMLRAVIDDHLARFAFRENFTMMTWSETVPTA